VSNSRKAAVEKYIAEVQEEVMAVKEDLSWVLMVLLPEKHMDILFQT
jgi:hypothetical protein